MLELVGEDLLGVEQQSADQCRLAVVDGAGGGEAQEVGAAGDGHQKYPSFLRSSMAASLTLSSPRVAPRSVIRVTEISAMT